MSSNRNSVFLAPTPCRKDTADTCFHFLSVSYLEPAGKSPQDGSSSVKTKTNFIYHNFSIAQSSSTTRGPTCARHHHVRHKTRQRHKELCALVIIFLMRTQVLYHKLLTIAMLNMGRSVYPRRLQYLTICESHRKGGTFSSVILRP